MKRAKPRKLELRLETAARLSKLDLSHVAGADPTVKLTATPGARCVEN
jgi:hypothetical protein